MQPVLLALAVSLMGVKTGWEPVDGGGLCYIVRLDAFELDVFQRERKNISSSLPPEVLQDLREIRIDMGTTDPPRQPSQLELLRKLEQAKAEKKTAESGAARDAPDDDRWSAESTRKTLDASSRAGAGKKRDGTDTATTDGPRTAKSPRLGKDGEDPASESGQETPATPSPPTRPGIINNLLTKPVAKAGTKKDDRQVAGAKDDAKDQPKASDAKKPASATPWAVALFLSLGGNVCLGWLLWESRVRCRTLLRSRYNIEPIDAEPDAA